MNEVARRAMTRLVREGERITKGADRESIADLAKKYPGSAANWFVRHAAMRDFLDALKAARDLIGADAPTGVRR